MIQVFRLSCKIASLDMAEIGAKKCQCCYFLLKLNFSENSGSQVIGKNILVQSDPSPLIFIIS